MDTVFKFKRFSVDQAGCTMKINTDGVLLGALAGANDPSAILDIGTGTGVIALMLAQRYPKARIDAVELDAGASDCAGRNFSSSPWASRLHIHHADFLEFEPRQNYQLIVSNPPYHINSLQNPDRRKTLARHTNAFFLSGMLEKARGMLDEDGSLWLVLPRQAMESVLADAGNSGLYLSQRIHVHDRPGKDAFRHILQFTRIEQTLVQKTFYIRNEEGEYAGGYQRLLADFFTIF